MRLRITRTLLSALGISCILSACSGSASETPEPEGPDAWQLKQRHATRAKLADQAAAEHDLPLGDFRRAEPARSTWGRPQRGGTEPKPELPREPEQPSHEDVAR